MLAAQATRGWFDAPHLEGARVQSSGVCTQSVVSMTCIRSNLMGRQRQIKDAQSEFIQGGRIAADRTWRSSKCECVGHS